MKQFRLGDLVLDVFDDVQPDAWTIENDAVRQVEELDKDSLYRYVTWGRKTFYVVLSLGKAIELPQGAAMKVSRLIACDEQAIRGATLLKGDQTQGTKG